MRWAEVIWIKFNESLRKPQKVLEFGISKGEFENSVQITIDYFDHQQIWELIQLFAPSATIAKDAHQKTSNYRTWIEEETEEMAQVEAPIRVSDSWIAKIGVWFALIVGLSFFVMIFVDEKWQQNDYWVGLIILICSGFFLSAIGLYGIFNLGRLEFDDEKITRRNFLGCKQIRWDELTHIEEASVSDYILRGHNESIAIPTPGYWSGRQKWEAARFFHWQIEVHNIEIRPAESLFSRLRKRLRAFLGR